MTKIQKAFCVLLSLCFLVVLTGMPEPFSVWENIYRQLPLYCFLEEQAMMVTLAGIVVVLMMMVQQISELFDTVKSVFNL